MERVVKKREFCSQMIFHKNVAAYCRVSTLQEIQYHSLDAQKEYYEKLIASHPEWVMVGIYADQASGRCNAKMQSFQRMIADCRNKKIDLILVKSISRMGRNTVEFLNVCDELRSLGVDVFFEIENLYLQNPLAMQMLTIYAALYQNESEERSYAIKWGIRARFADGSSGLANRTCYGYRLNEDKKLVPDLQMAAVVQMIFEWHSQGLSLRKISDELHKRNICSPRGKEVWGVESIRKLLNNEKYYGNVLLQKTYVSEYFAGKQSVNRGEYAQYLIEQNHPSIIKR